MGKKECKTDLIVGPATQTLAYLIPAINIITHHKIFRQIEAIDISGLPDFPEKEINEIKYNLESLHRKKWISDWAVKRVIRLLEKEVVVGESAEESIARAFCWGINPDGTGRYEDFDNYATKWFIVTARNRLKLKPGHPRNRAYDFLVFALTFDLKFYQKRPHYGEVLSFLEEQNIIEHGSKTEDNLRKQLKGLDMKTIGENLIYFYIISNEIIDLKSFFEPNGAYQRSPFIRDLMEIYSSELEKLCAEFDKEKKELGIKS